MVSLACSGAGRLLALNLESCTKSVHYVPRRYFSKRGGTVSALSRSFINSHPSFALQKQGYETTRFLTHSISNHQRLIKDRCGVKGGPGGGSCLLSQTVPPASALPLSSPMTTSHQHRGIWDIFKRANFGNYAVLSNVGQVSAPLLVPPNVPCPPHALTGEPQPGPSSPEVKAEWQVQAMKTSCILAAQIQTMVGHNIKVGMTTEKIDALVHEAAVEAGAYPSPLNYLGFPKSVCTSVNNVACHGIPDNRPLQDGDIISVDITVYYEGHHGDCCETYLVGNVDEAGRHLVRAARRCRDEAIALCAPGVPFAAIGFMVKDLAKLEGVTVVPCFIGHGIGQYFHGPPDIYHCYNDYPGTMEEGMTFTIEPIVAQGKEEVLILEDGWTAVMVDNGRAAQFEHTILVTQDGHQVLTDVQGS